MLVEKLSDLFEQARAAQTQDPTRKLAPDRHPNRDFFIADILDWALKGDLASMEHPMFSLAKKPDTRIRRYQHNGVASPLRPVCWASRPSGIRTSSSMRSANS